MPNSRRNSPSRIASRRRNAGALPLLLLAVAAGGVALAASTRRGTAVELPQTPTFARDIAPIIYDNCASCHRPGGLGPMPLLTYADVRENASEIRDKVQGGVMPPWHADGPRDVFLNDRRLSDAQKSALLRWIDGGTPPGNAAEQPAAPDFDNSWTIGTPDTVIVMPVEVEVPAQGTIEYQYIRIPTGFSEDRWVQAIEIMPGAREVVHHVLVYSRVPAAITPGQAAGRGVGRGGARDGAPPTAGNRSGARGGRGPSANALGALIATTAPGTNAQVFPEGTALRIPAGAVLTLQMHYTAHGHAMKDRSSVGIVFAKGPPAREMRASYFINARLEIPPGANDHRVDAQVTFPTAVRIYGILPHTHLRGKRWEYRLVTPDGKSESILSVPRYDFNWQTYYMFREPLAVPAGSRMESSVWYDNSAGNPSNPDPTAAVRWGDQTWEEMQYTGFLFTADSLRRR